MTLIHVIIVLLALLLCVSAQQPKMNTIDEGTDKVGIFDHDSPMGRRGVGRKDIRAHMETMKYHRAGPRNTRGHRILETHDNGSYTLEIDHFGVKRRLTSDTINSTIAIDPSLTLLYDPPNGTFSPKALALYVQASDPAAKVYYAFENVITLAAEQPTLQDSYVDYDHPYIHLGLRFLAKRVRRCTIVAVAADEQTRSEQYELHFIVEADARPNSFGFLTPGTETDGYFIKFSLEMAAAARAQVAGGQELADFYTDLGVGTYVGQVTPLKLNLIHADLKAFEGGMAVNCSGSNDNEPFKHWGILPPWHSGTKFTGKVVRVDLVRMSDNETCIADYRHEYINSAGHRVVEGPGNESACITIIDLPSLHVNARGFRRGFVNYPYVYLSPGEFNVPVRLDACNLSLATTTFIDLGTVNRSLGGYSGGFQDGDWSCFNPFRTYVGPFGGLRSTDEVDNYQLRPYYHSYLLCVHAWAWTANKTESIANATRVVDLEDVDPELRGFSEALRVGRYAYLTPLAERPHSYTSKVIRINLGTVDIGHMLDYLDANNMKIREIVDVLNLKLIDENLKGFSGMFQSKCPIILDIS